MNANFFGNGSTEAVKVKSFIRRAAIQYTGVTKKRRDSEIM